MAVSRACTKQLTLVLLHATDQVLLGMKKRGFGMNKYNGFGGKIEPGETIKAAAVREMHEESGVTLHDATYTGHILFQFENKDEELEVHVFRATEFSGTPEETDEMKPEWFPTSGIPYERMWKDDEIWLPLLLAGKRFDAKFLFRGHDVILSHHVEEVSSLPLDAETAVLVSEVQTAISV